MAENSTGTKAKSKAIQWKGVWWRGTKKVSQCLALCNFSFLLHLSKVKYHRHKNCHSIMFVEEWLHPHGVSNLLHTLTIKNIKVVYIWSQRKGWVCACVNKVPVYFWLNFKLKRDRKLRSTCRVAVCIGEDLNITNIRDCKRAMKQHVYQHCQRTDYQSKITWNQVCTRHKLLLMVFLYQKQISCLHVVIN